MGIFKEIIIGKSHQENNWWLLYFKNDIMEDIKVNEYEVVGRFDCHGIDMVIIRMGDATHVMSTDDWKKVWGRLHPGRWEKEKLGKNREGKKRKKIA